MNYRHRQKIISLLMALFLLFGTAPTIVRGASADTETYSKIAAHNNSSFAIKTDSSLWAWGNNTGGQLGDGSNITRLFPVKIMDDVISVTTSGDYTLAIKSDGSLWSWGNSGLGLLGDSSYYSGLFPKKIMDTVVRAAAGRGTTFVVKEDGSLWACGNNKSGQLGDGTTAFRQTFIKIMDDVYDIISVDSHALAIKTDGSLWAWGLNSNGQVGDGTYDNRSVPIKLLDGVVRAAVGYDFSMAIADDGALWVWGKNNGHGLSALTDDHRIPSKVMDEVEDVVCGSMFALIIKTDNSLWASGDNYHGQLGDGTYIDRRSPVKVMNNVIAIAAGRDHSLAVKTDGSLWGWGSDSNGQLGDGTGSNYATPIPALADITDVVRMAVGEGHSMALKDDNSLWTWGNNTQGQLGDGMHGDRPEPRKVLDNVIDMAGGSNHTLAVQSDGSLWAWGYNGYGQVGDGSVVIRRTPVKVLDDVINVEAGTHHSLAIKADGSLWIWGINANGQIGDGTNTNRYTPIKIMDDVTDMAAGYTHTVALKNDGSLWAWGNNSSGQLGNGTTVNSPLPIKIMEDVAQVSASMLCTQVVKTDGSLCAWGQNSTGQVGDGTKITRLTPVKVLDDAARVASGGGRTFALMLDNSLLAWGYGLVGDGNINSTIRSHPVKILDNAADVFTGYNQTYVIKTDGSLWSWGLNSRGALGYNETIPRELMPAGTIFTSDGAAEENKNITSVIIKGLTAPAAESYPVSADALFTPDKGYDITSILWVPDVTPHFVQGGIYSAIITLTSKDGYMFVDGATPSVSSGVIPLPATISGGDIPGNTLTFTVEFAAAELAPNLEISISEWIIPWPDDDIIKVSIESRTPWTAVSDSEWLTVSPDEGNGKGSFILAAAENIATESRIGTVRITAGDDYRTIIVTQEAARPYLHTRIAGWYAYAAGQILEVSVISNVAWTASSDAEEWLTVSPADGTGDGRLTLTATPNPTEGWRSGYITIASETLTFVISVTQFAATLSVSPKTLVFAEDGEEKTVSVTSNRTWTVSSDVEWLTLTSDHGAGDVNLSLTAAKNITPDKRTGTVTVTAGGLTKTVVVTQNASSKVQQAMLSVDPVNGKMYGDEPFQLSATGGSGDGAVTFTLVSGTAEITPTGLVTIRGAGDIVVTASKAGDNFHHAVTSDERTISIAKRNQSPLVFAPVGEKQPGDEPFRLIATGGSTGGLVSYELVSGTAVMVTPDGTVTIVEVGEAVIKAVMDGDENHDSVSAEITIVVSKSTETGNSGDGDSGNTDGNGGSDNPDGTGESGGSGGSDNTGDTSGPGGSGGDGGSGSDSSNGTDNTGSNGGSDGNTNGPGGSDSSNGADNTGSNGGSGSSNNGGESNSTGGSGGSGGSGALGGSGGSGGSGSLDDASSQTSINDTTTDTPLSASSTPSGTTPPIINWRNPYTDVTESGWFYEAVQFVTENGLMNGMGENKFAPDVIMSRAMLVTTLYRLAGISNTNIVNNANSFNDVKNGEWYTDAIIWASENGIVEGYPDGNFGVNDAITREQFVAILYRYAQSQGLDVGTTIDLSMYDDNDSISDWALDAMRWAVSADIVKGRTATAIEPKGLSLRSETATILMRFFHYSSS